MKNVLFALLLIPSLAFGQQFQAQGQQQGQQQGMTNTQESGDQYTTLRNSYEAMASSAASLDLPYCGEGVSGQNSDGGFSIAQTSYVCEAATIIRVNLQKMESALAQYDSGREAAITPDGKTLADRHLVTAHLHMLKIDAIIEDLNTYIEGRRDTAGIGAASKDLVWPGILLALLFLL